MGDCNAPPESYSVKKISGVLWDADEKNSLTRSVYPEGCSICLVQRIQYKLDYILVSKDIKICSFEVGGSTGSDHLLISAIIEI